MTQLAALVFDVDGTLADTEREGHRVAFNRAFADAGLDWEWGVERYGELLAITGGKERIGAFIAAEKPDFRPPAGQSLAAYIADLHRAKTEHYTRMLRQDGLPLRPGVGRLLGEARHAGVRLAIATTTTPDNVDALLAANLGPAAGGWFEVIACGDVVPAKKPAPDIYHYTLERMGLAPADCLALEDSANGLASARAAGLATVVTINDYTRDHDFSGAALVTDQLGEPGRPMRVLAGDAGGADHVDLELLRYLHARAGGGQAVTA